MQVSQDITLIDEWKHRFTIYPDLTFLDMGDGYEISPPFLFTNDQKNSLRFFLLKKGNLYWLGICDEFEDSKDGFVYNLLPAEQVIEILGLPSKIRHNADTIGDYPQVIINKIINLYLATHVYNDGKNAEQYRTDLLTMLGKELTPPASNDETTEIFADNIIRPALWS